MSNLQTTSQFYQDNLGNRIVLGKELARGGEGMVCLVDGKPDLVAKIYFNKALLKYNKSEKIKVMCNLYDADIAKYNALPQRVIYNSKSNVVGFLMEKIIDFKEIHNLYGISTKRKLFGFADWRFMVHAAKNLAIAVDKLHSKNIIIGDINQGNILVDNQAMIKLIDCDSYQVEYNGKFYLCEVGVPEYTSPELQGQSFNGIQRTKNHDCFGLAVMIFKILMFGKHPYSGVGAPPEIENAIKQGYYCFGSGAIQPNPNSAQWYYSQIFSTLNYDIKDMFERAFSTNKNSIRPTAEEWVRALDNFEGSLIQCSANNLHKYSNSGNSCIWCQLTQKGFTPFVNTTTLLKPNNKPNYQQTPYLTSNIQQNYPSQQPTQNWFNSFFKNHPYLTTTIIFFIIFVIISAIAENSNNNQVLKPQYENAQTNNVQTQNTTSIKEAQEEVQVQKEIENNVNVNSKTKNINEFKNLFVTTVQNNWKQDPNQGEITVEVTLNRDGSIAKITPLEKISTNSEHPDYNFIRAQKAIQKTVSWGYLPQDYQSNHLTLLLKFSLNKVEIVVNSKSKQKESLKKNEMLNVQDNSNLNQNNLSNSQTKHQKVKNDNKSDLQKSSDWFFE